MKKVLILCIGVIVAATSCKKNQLDGKSTIKGTVAHHAKAIAFATVFIKFDAKEFPGEDTTAYSAKVRADKDGNFSIKCYKGDYYLYGYGYDYGIDPPYTVVGGIPVRIRAKEDLKVNLGVSED